VPYPVCQALVELGAVRYLYGAVPLRRVFQPTAAAVDFKGDLPMYLNSLATLAQCQDVVHRYRLGPLDFEAGTVEGFTAYLLCRGMELAGVEDLAVRLGRYQREAAAGLDEAALFEEARGLNDLLNEHARARRDIASRIEALKCRPGGMGLWVCVAELATSPDAQRDAICAQRGVTIQNVQLELAWLKQFHWLVMESVNNLKYVPGNNPTLDRLLRKDIEVLDHTLINAAPWSGAQDDTTLELNAIHRLMA